MASKTEDMASKHNDGGSKQQGGGRRRGHDKNQGGPKHHEEGAAKKKNPGQSSTRHSNRGRSHSGGKDLAQHRNELQQQSGGSSVSTKSSWPREGNVGHAKQQNRSHHHRNGNSSSSRSTEQSRRGQQGRSQDRPRAYRQQLGASKNSESSENTCTPLDSGIGMDDGSSPEAVVESENIAAGSVSSTDGEQETSAEQSPDLTLTNSCEDASSGLAAKTASSDKEEGSPEQSSDNATKRVVHLTYSRKQLIEMKECVQSLLKPSGLDKIPGELLKTNNRHAGEAWESHHGDVELGEDGKAKHPTTLSLIREHDMKQMTRVSLSPQRRSFGSGCSWRDQFSLSPLNRQSTAVSVDGSAPMDQEDTTDQHAGAATHPLGLHAYAHGATPSSPHGHTHHPPRVIPHVPYRSRQNHGDLPHHWRESPPQQVHEDDQEPEWMAFGPSDRTEFIELKGLDEHEARKEADRQAQSRNDGASHSLEKEKLGNADPALDSGLGSANPSFEDCNESEPSVVVEKSAPDSPLKDQFVLDGFDFSTGLSICHTLESDSDEEQPEHATTDVSNSEQLSCALMKVLGIGTDKTVPAPPSSGRAKAVTLDEIEAPLTRQDDDGDTTAFHKLLAVLHSSGAMQDEVATAGTGARNLVPFHGAGMAIPTCSAPAAPPPPIGHLSKGGPVSGRMLYHGAGGLERDGMALAASLQLSAQHSGRAQSLEQQQQQQQRLLYSHTPPVPRSHQTPLVSSDLTGTKAARWSLAGQQWPTLSSSSASSYPYYQQPSPGTTSHIPSLSQQHLAGNSTWVTEMEKKRLLELRQFQHYQEYQQQSRQHSAVLNRKALGNPNNIQPHNNLSHGHVPNNLSLLPTSVIRQIHTCKTNQLLSDMSQAQQAAPPHTHTHSGRRLDHEVSQRSHQTSPMMSSVHGQSEVQPSLHPSPSMMPSSRGVYHGASVYGGVAPHSLQSGSLAMQADPPNMMSQTGYLNSASFFPQQLRMGVATVKQSPY